MKKKAVYAERTSRQSAAEFFSEHQQIAGFDNVCLIALFPTLFTVL